MYKTKRILVVIPARGGSKAIPRKNVRLLAGKPLIAYSIQTALQSLLVDDVLVSTEDSEIAGIAENYGSGIVKRPEELAKDNVPLDPVIFHALRSVELKRGITYDYVVSMQPTSPLLSTEILDKAIIELIDSKCDTLITIKEETHLYWTRKSGFFIPLYNERKNRQFLDPIYRETGGLLISRRNVITEKNRIGSQVHLFEVPSDQNIDIDTYQDWWIAENILRRLTVVFRVDGDREIGLGHIYRALTLANRMFNQKLYFLMDESRKLGITKIGEYNYPIVMIANRDDALKKLAEIQPNVVINDILDTDEGYILNLKKKGFFVVNFEDLGEGADRADLVINALYEKSEPLDNSYYGYKYVCLRDDFFIFKPKGIEKKVQKLIILFGGSDPNNLTLRSLRAIEKLDRKSISILIILGLGYGFRSELDNYVNHLRNEEFKITIKENVKTVAKLLSEADLAITSNGRTIYEVASMGVPCISISQNEREVRHLFSHTCKGVVDLGIASNVSENDIALTIKKVLDDYPFRQKMSHNLRGFNLKLGTDRVLRLIFEKYWEKQNETNSNRQ